MLYAILNTENVVIGHCWGQDKSSYSKDVLFVEMTLENSPANYGDIWNGSTFERNVDA